MAVSAYQGANGGRKHADKLSGNSRESKRLLISILKDVIQSVIMAKIEFEHRIIRTKKEYVAFSAYEDSDETRDIGNRSFQKA